MRAISHQVGQEVAAMVALPAHHNQVGIAAGWLTRYMNGPGNSRDVPQQDLAALFTAAGAYWTLKNALVEVRSGARTFTSRGTLVRLAYNSNHALDALDRVLDTVDRVDEIERAPRALDPRLRDWLALEGMRRPWSVLPEWVRDQFRERAKSVIEVVPRHLPADATIAGLSMSDYDTLWSELLAWGMHMVTAVTLGSTHPPTVGPLVHHDDVVALLARATGLKQSLVSRAISLLTLDLDRCGDGALTPFIPIEDQIVPMGTLIVCTSPQRNLLAILQSDPSLFGEAGRLLGRAGEEATVDLLRRLRPGILLSKRIKVLRPGGERAGDLDVVVCEPLARRVVILEIKWSIPADGNAEFYKTEQAAIEKRNQVVRLRKEILSGNATPEWPVEWPDIRTYDFRWYVLTRDVLATRNVSEDDITIRSVQLLTRTLRRDASLADLVTALDNPPEPPPTLCETYWERFRYGDVSVEVELIRA